ncbi:MAG: twin-arginine translocation pathway signal protein, partial [Alphaproteobacteria bacterium]|nr:twin-arginine translocation pathway signal protein [Alphaproteobacteria bacterium]
TIGLGCFLELFSIALSKEGMTCDITPFPDGYSDKQLDSRRVALIHVYKSTSVAKDPLFDQILNRRSNKKPFDTNKTIDNQALAKLVSASNTPSEVYSTNEEKQLSQLRELTNLAMELEIKTPRTYQESIDLMRIGKSEINANPDGIALGGPFLESLNKLGMLTRESLGDPSSDAYQQGIDMFKEITESAMGYLWISTKTNTRLDQIRVGRDYVRLNLKAAELGLAYHPLSQALQEYTEMDRLYGQVHQITAQEGSRIQMLVRLGYGIEIDPSPRWPIDAKIIA